MLCLIIDELLDEVRNMGFLKSSKHYTQHGAARSHIARLHRGQVRTWRLLEGGGPGAGPGRWEEWRGGGASWKMEARRLPGLWDRRLEMSHSLSCTIPSTAGRTGQLDCPQGDVAVGAGGGGPRAAGTSRAWRPRRLVSLAGRGGWSSVAPLGLRQRNAGPTTCLYNLVCADSLFSWICIIFGVLKYCTEGALS